jgi:hypothetical protein
VNGPDILQPRGIDVATLAPSKAEWDVLCALNMRFAGLDNEQRGSRTLVSNGRRSSRTPVSAPCGLDLDHMNTRRK